MALPRSVHVAIFSAGVALGVLGVLALRRQTPHEGEESVSRSESSEELRPNEHLAGLEATLARIQQRLGRLEAKQLESNRPSAPATSVTTPSHLPTSDELEEQFTSRSGSAQAEPRDEAWAKPEEERLRKIAEIPLPSGGRSTVEKLSCRTSICTMQLAFPSFEDSRTFPKSFLAGMRPDEMAGSHFKELHQRPDGAYLVEILVFRQGYPMPGLPDSNK